MNKFAVIFLFLMAAAAIKTKAQTVYASAKGEKYHIADCRLSGDAESITLAAAKKAGKTGCSVCKPDDHIKDATTQCTGKTADGTQCKRMTATKDGRCFQHKSK